MKKYAFISKVKLNKHISIIYMLFSFGLTNWKLAKLTILNPDAAQGMNDTGFLTDC